MVLFTCAHSRYPSGYGTGAAPLRDAGGCQARIPTSEMRIRTRAPSFIGTSTRWPFGIGLPSLWMWVRTTRSTASGVRAVLGGCEPRRSVRGETLFAMPLSDKYSFGVFGRLTLE